MKRIVMIVAALALAATCFGTTGNNKNAPEDGAVLNLTAEEDPLIGKKFMDLEEPDQAGTVHKLSEYVGCGRWVLVDFWAAWCNPCKMEMPNVVAAYKKYHDKGFDVVGLSIDRNREDWVRAIREWDMPWIHLSDLKYSQSEAVKVYGVSAIPDNLLIDPDGVIVARGLRGSELDARLAEIFK